MRISERNKRKIQWISFFLAFGVISIHTYNVEIYHLSSQSGGLGSIVYFVENWIYRMQKVCIPFFFLISGYLFFRTYTWNRVIEKYKTRIRTLLVPYLLWCTIYFLLYFVITNLPILASHMNMEKVPLSFEYYLDCLLIKKDIVLYFWFIRDLMLMVIAAPLYYGLFKKKDNYILDIISILGSFALIGYSIVWQLNFLNTYFLVGGFLALRCTKYVESASKFKIMVSVVGIVLCMIWLPPEEKLGGRIWRLLLIAFVWYAADIFKFEKEPRWSQKQTFFFYCAHGFPLEALEKLWLIIAGNYVWAAVLDYVLMPIIITGILSVAAYVLNKYCGKLYQVLTGNRIG